jgi:phage terminase small subunit
MAALKDARHEKFVLALFEGKSASAAYVAAGFKPCRQNASRLLTKADIRERLSELQGGAAKSAAITVEGLCAELNEAIALGKTKGQIQACVSAVMSKAKLAGLLTEKIEIGRPGEFDGLESTKQIASKVLERLVEQFVPVDQADLDGLVEMYERHVTEAEEYIAAIKTRPIIAERVDTRHLDRPWQSHPQYAPKGSLRIGYKTNGVKHHTQPPEPEVRKIAADPSEG